MLADSMQILHAQSNGFCYGVQRASRLAEELIQKGVRPVYTLGPLIHNPQEVARLAKLGIEPRERIDDCIGGVTLLRTHGITKAEFARAKELGIDWVDAICPRVKVPRRHIDKFLKQGRTVLLLGDSGHPEVQALLSYSTGKVSVVTGADEVAGMDLSEPVGVVAQTTQSREAFERVVAACRERQADTASAFTICDDSEMRQNESRKLAARVDLMLVIGGHNSANTRRLAEICRQVQSRTHHVESADDLTEIDFASVNRVGLTAGASTPDWIVSQVDECLRKSLKNHVSAQVKCPP